MGPARSALAEGEKVLRSFDGLTKAPEEFLKVFIALDEINFGSVYDEEIRTRIAE